MALIHISIISILLLNYSLASDYAAWNRYKYYPSHRYSQEHFNVEQSYQHLRPRSISHHSKKNHRLMSQDPRVDGIDIFSHDYDYWNKRDANNTSKGRGIIKALFDTKDSVMSSLFDLNPIDAIGNLVEGVLDVASEAGSGAERVLGALQKGVSGVVSDGLNDLFEPEKMHIRFPLYTLKNQEEPQLLYHTGDIYNTNFDKTKGVKLLIHGFSPLRSPLFDMIGMVNVSDRTLIVLSLLTIKKSYLNKMSEDNIIAVDWTSVSGTLNYPTAAAATRAIGKVVQQFLVNLHGKGNINPDKVHIIGFSLGAQISGTAGRLFHEKTGVKLGRITGLDPAGPGFDLISSKLTGSSTAPEDLRFMVDQGDANFVDIIHSNAKLGGLGMVSNTGHANFFPNGGETQPGCSTIPIYGGGGSTRTQTNNAAAGCSHSRAWEFYAESVTSEKYPACQCDSSNDFASGKCNCNSKVFMGDLCDPTARGTYYLDARMDTAYDVPYAEQCEKEEKLMFSNMDEKFFAVSEPSEKE